MVRRSFSFLMALCIFLFSLSLNGIAEGYLRGDVDGNGKITAFDARMTLRIVHSLEKNPSPASIIAADFNQDKEISITDVKSILRVAAGLDFHPDGLSDDLPLDLSDENNSFHPEGDEFRGLWVASIANLDFPSSANLSIEQIKQELDNIVADTEKWGLNTIFFQVRPSSDALYRSEIYPVSKFLTSDENFLLRFNPLEYIIEKAHSAGFQLHAWINPLRITTGTANRPEHEPSLLPLSSPARKNPEWTVPYADGKLYFDAGYPQVRQLVTDGVLEIVRNYDIDGIHFDDYFYPYPFSDASFDDSKSYASYGGGRNLGDFRRDNINSLVAQVYKAIKNENEQLLFGISPFAVWRNASTDPHGSETKAGIETYDDIFADSRKWVREGLLDYICPQIYWSMEHDSAEYRKVFDWWEACVKGTDVKLLVGHAFQKIGGSEKGWERPNELINQIKYAARSENYRGSVFFRYKYLLENPLGVTEMLRDFYS